MAVRSLENPGAILAKLGNLCGGALLNFAHDVDVFSCSCVLHGVMQVLVPALSEQAGSL